MENETETDTEAFAGELLAPGQMPDADVLRSAISLGMTIGAIGEVHQDDEGNKYSLVPAGFGSLKTPALNPKLPDHVQQEEVFIELESFLTYVLAFATLHTVIMGSVYQTRISATFDYHKKPNPEADNGVSLAVPDRCKQKAHFQTDYDPNWKKWRAIDGKTLSQLEFAYFIEEMMHTIAEPNGADLLEMAQTLKVNRNVVYKQNKRLASGETDIQFTEEDSTNSGSVAVPEEITLAVPIFMMRAAEKVVIKLRYRLNPGEPLSFHFDILNIELIELAAFNALCVLIRERTEIPVLLCK